MSIISKRREQESSQSGKHLLTKDEFFKQYVDHTTLLKFSDGRLTDVEEMDTFFEQIKAKGTFQFPKKVNQDKGRLPYKFVDFIAPMGTIGAKVVLIGKMNEFIWDYFQGKFTTDFTFEELLDEAESK